MRKYFISGFNRNVDSVLSYRVQLQAEPSINELDQLLADFYIHIDRKPEYVFLCQEDLATISKDLRDAM